ncbi:hypothetical protein CO712_00385 [Burkholderia gladioli pv. gladioli]|nr:hypothetical protein CO712_00385 [Burkholderia gladioli pv. gladioli]
MKCAGHLAVRLFELRGVDQLAALLGERQQFDLAIDALGHRPFGHQIDAGSACAAGRDLAQMPDIRDADLIDRCRLVVEPDLVNEPRNGRLVEIQMLGDL